MELKTRMKVLYAAYREAKDQGHEGAAEKLYLRFIRVSYELMPN